MSVYGVFHRAAKSSNAKIFKDGSNWGLRKWEEKEEAHQSLM